MRRVLVSLSVVWLFVAPAVAQTTSEAELRRTVPFSEMKKELPTLTLEQYNRAVREVARQRSTPSLPTVRVTPVQPAPKSVYLGRLSVNPYLPDSTASPVGRGNPYGDTVTNPDGRYGSPYSPNSATNPYATRAPQLYGQDGTYLGRLSKNPYDPQSVTNPYGRYGNPYSPDSINNPYGRFGSPYSPYSPTNPYATQPPVVIGRPR